MKGVERKGKEADGERWKWGERERERERDDSSFFLPQPTERRNYSLSHKFSGLVHEQAQTA